MTIIITDHHHPRTMQSSWSWQSVYDAIIIIRVRCNHHHLCTIQSSWWQSSFVYDATIMMTIIIIRVRCDHHHLCTVLLSWFVYDAIIIDHHDLCTMWSSSFVYNVIIIIRVQCDHHHHDVRFWHGKCRDNNALFACFWHFHENND